jgi:hypothetical protein
MDEGPLGGGRSRTGWLAFAGAYLLVAGTMNGIWALAALTDLDLLRADDLAWSTLSTWGWVSLAAAAAQLAAGALVLARRGVGRILAGVIAFAALFVNFVSIGAYPIWSLLALIANGLVLWAVTVYGDAFE